MKKRILLLLGIVLSLSGHTAPEDDSLLQAEKYYRLDNTKRFRTAAAKIAPDSVYAPLLDYWAAMLDLRRDTPQAAEHFIDHTASPYLGNDLRRRLLEWRLKRKEWEEFSRFAGDGDNCSGTLNKWLRNENVRDAVRTLWAADNKMNQVICNYLYQRALASELLTDEDIWIKLRGLAGTRELTVSRRLLALFPGYIRYRDVRAVANRPVRYIKSKHGLRTRASRELVMIAAMAAVRSKPKTALRRWRQFSPYFSEAENSHVKTVLAEWAARWHRTDALDWYRETDGNYDTDNTRAWRVRAALRAGDDAEVVRVIDTMPPAQQSLSAWRYWWAIAQERLGETEEAATALAALAADEDDYYGLLAREAMALPLIVAEVPREPLPAVTGDFALALALYQVGLKRQADRLWRHAIKHDATNAALLAAAAAAAKADWYLASINAANKADSSLHTLRFPQPYREEIDKYSRRFNLDPAFVYGLIRQESRFMPNIVSSANARGLMQVIPRTARQVARRHGYGKYRLSRLTRVDTNVIIGTTYLSGLSDRFAAAAPKVAAAYNAGPSRVRRWYKNSSDILVAIENIPITETRLYVKHVLANRLHYAVQMQRDVDSMRNFISHPMRGPQVAKL